MTAVEQSSDFEKINSAEDKNRIVNSLVDRQSDASLYTDDKLEFSFVVEKYDKKVLTLRPTAPWQRALVVGENVAVSIASIEGSFFIRGPLQLDSSGKVLLVVNDLFRLQRRANFRAQVSKSSVFPIQFEIRTFCNKALPQIINVADLSVGGARLVWPFKEGLKIEPGNPLAGNLKLKSKTVEVFAQVRHVTQANEPGFLNVGVQFQNLALRDEQALLSACLQLSRELISAFQRLG